MVHVITRSPARARLKEGEIYIRVCKLKACRYTLNGVVAIYSREKGVNYFLLRSSPSVVRSGESESRVPLTDYDFLKTVGQLEQCSILQELHAGRRGTLR